MLALPAMAILLTGTGVGPGSRCTSPEPAVLVCHERLRDGGSALALFNRGARAVSVDVIFHRLGIQPQPQVSNVTNGTNWGKVQGGFAQRVEPRGSVWFRLRPAAD